jgi:hypothetical protein
MRIEEIGDLVKTRLPHKIREFRRGDKVRLNQRYRQLFAPSLLPDMDRVYTVSRVRFHPDVMSYDDYPDHHGCQQSSKESRGHTQEVQIKTSRRQKLARRVSGCLLEKVKAK